MSSSNASAAKKPNAYASTDVTPLGFEERAAGWLPYSALRAGIRSRLAQVILEVEGRDPSVPKVLGVPPTSVNPNPSIEDLQAIKMQFIQRCKASPILETQSDDAANTQHYEVPTEFFRLVMGRFMKYSCCYYGEPSARQKSYGTRTKENANTITLDAAEEAMLSLVCERVQITHDSPKLRVLDLGCGWGSFSLFAAERFPEHDFVGLSNSATQREYIEGRAREKGLTNLTVLTRNIGEFEGDELQNTFDRIVSNEMFEHMKNYQLLIKKLSGWLVKDGLMFIHIFCHKRTPYDFEPGNWMADFFFQGGTMPSQDLLMYFQDDMAVENHWDVNGMHYKYTCDQWLANMDKSSHWKELRQIMADTYGEKNIDLWIARWRLFFLACGELFAYDGGNEWFVTHYLFRNRK